MEHAFCYATSIMVPLPWSAHSLLGGGRHRRDSGGGPHAQGCVLCVFELFCSFLCFCVTWLLFATQKHLSGFLILHCLSRGISLCFDLNFIFVMLPLIKFALFYFIFNSMLLLLTRMSGELKTRILYSQSVSVSLTRSGLYSLQFRRRSAEHELVLGSCSRSV